jgi:hypothetical protein
MEAGTRRPLGVSNPCDTDDTQWTKGGDRPYRLLGVRPTISLPS